MKIEVFQLGEELYSHLQTDLRRNNESLLIVIFKRYILTVKQGYASNSMNEQII